MELKDTHCRCVDIACRHTHHKPTAAEAANMVKMVVLVVCYSLCSSMLLIINKVWCELQQTSAHTCSCHRWP